MRCLWSSERRERPDAWLGRAHASYEICEFVGFAVAPAVQTGEVIGTIEFTTLYCLRMVDAKYLNVK